MRKYSQENANLILLSAVEHGNMEGAERAITELHADVNCDGGRALFDSIANFDEEMFYFLRYHGADPRRCKFPILSVTAEWGNLSIAMDLLRNGMKASCDKEWPVIYAAEQGNVEMASFLIEQGVPYSNEAANAAARHGKTAVLRFLFSKGIDPSVNGWAVLRWAKRTNAPHSSTVIYLEKLKESLENQTSGASCEGESIVVA